MASLGRSPQPTSGQAGRARRWLLAQLLPIALALTSAARAQPPAAGGEASSGPQPTAAAKPAAPAESMFENLSVEPGATCLSRDRLIDRISRWRERRLVDTSIHVDVRGDRRVPTRVFYSVTRGATPPTERMLDNAPSDCDQLHSAVALSIALAIDAMLAAERGQRSSGLNGKPSPQPSAAGEERGEGPGSYVELGLLAGASVGVVPNTAAAGLPRLQYAPLPWFSLALAGIATRATNATITGATGSFDATLLAGGLDACFGGETVERLSFFTCVGGRGGVFTTKGMGFSANDSKSLPFWGLSASGQARAWILPEVAIGISVEALFALAARELVVNGEPGENLPSLKRTIPRVGLSIAAGPVFRFF